MLAFKSALMLSSTALLAACTTADMSPISGPQGAGAQSEASAVSVADTSQDAALNAFFDRVDAQDLASSPVSKAYRGIRDADYGKWDDPSDAAAIADYQRGQAALAENAARFRPRQARCRQPPQHPAFRLSAGPCRQSISVPRRPLCIRPDERRAEVMLPAFLINIHKVENAQQAADYVSRLESMGPYIDQAHRPSAPSAPTRASSCRTGFSPMSSTMRAT